jgi:hypothetical protein
MKALRRLGLKEAGMAPAQCGNIRLRLLENEAHFIEAVRRGFDSLDRGEYLTHEEVGQRLERLFPS